MCFAYIGNSGEIYRPKSKLAELAMEFKATQARDDRDRERSVSIYTSGTTRSGTYSSAEPHWERVIIHRLIVVANCIHVLAI